MDASSAPHPRSRALRPIGLAGWIAPATPSPGASAEAWLAPTPYIDHDHPDVSRTSERLTHGLTGDLDKAVAVHDFVRDEVVFGFEAGFYDLRASEVLRTGRGYCNNQGTLFVALLRAAGVPARLRFYALSSRVLDGVIDPGTLYVDHGIGEVFLEGVWRRVDSYIIDLPLAAGVRTQLEAPVGLSMRRDARHDWDGRSDSFSQLHPDFVREEYGVFEDAATFYADVPNAHNRLGFIGRLAFPFIARSANTRLDRLRASSDP